MPLPTARFNSCATMRLHLTELVGPMPPCCGLGIAGPSTSPRNARMGSITLRGGEREEEYAFSDFGLDAFLPRRHAVVRSRNPRWRITGND